MINELVKEMVEAGVHYGHQTKKWNPKMKPYLMKDKGGIYIIDLDQNCSVPRSGLRTSLAELAGKNKKDPFCRLQATGPRCRPRGSRSNRPILRQLPLAWWNSHEPRYNP